MDKNPTNPNTTNTLLQAALAYATTLSWPVFPCVPGEKRPLTAHGVKDATTDPAQITEWWTRWPDANIGLACGERSGVTVLDVDVKPWKGKRGDRTLAELVRLNGALPQTIRQRTWSGGEQYFFTFIPGVKNGVNSLGDGLDVRNEGGYVLLPPSRVGEDGRGPEQYAWLAHPDGTAVAEAPAWLTALMREGRPERPAKKPKAAQTSTAQTNGRMGAEAADALARGENRSTSTLRLLGTMARAGLSQEAMRAAMSAQNAASADPLPDEKLESLLRHAATWQETASDLDGEYTDTAHAERLAALAGDSIRYCRHSRDWYIFDGKRWARETSWSVIARYVRQLAKKFYFAAGAETDVDKSRRYAEQGQRLDSRRVVQDVITMAQSLEALQVEAKVFDTDPDLLNVANGTLDLRTFELRGHAREDMLTFVLDVPYAPGAACPRWRAFLDQVFLGNQAVIDFVQRAVGYTLTGRIDEQVLFLLHGGGQNGKSTFVEILSALLGPYATKVDQETVLAADKNRGRGATPELMVMVGKRFAYIDELEEERQLDEARVKALTGSATGTGRELYKGMGEWRNTAKLWFDLNHLPGYRGIDEGIARRPKVIPFAWRVPDEQKDGALSQKLRDELPGILAWAVEGCRRWREQGLNPPDAVGLASQAYAEANNHLPAFARETYVKSPTGRVPVADMKTDYAGWCTSRGEQPLDYQKKVVKFFETMWGLRRVKTHGAMVWTGIAAKRDQERIDAIVVGVLAQTGAGGGNGGEVPRGEAGDPFPQLPYTASNRGL